MFRPLYGHLQGGLQKRSKIMADSVVNVHTWSQNSWLVAEGHQSSGRDLNHGPSDYAALSPDRLVAGVGPRTDVAVVVLAMGDPPVLLWNRICSGIKRSERDSYRLYSSNDEVKSSGKLRLQVLQCWYRNSVTLKSRLIVRVLPGGRDQSV